MPSLIDHKVKESRTIEYKRQLPGNAEGDRHGLLAAITSLVNLDDEDQLFGVDAKKGIPIAIPTIGEHDEDDLERI